MPFKIYWDDDDRRIMIHEFVGTVSLEDYIAITDRNRELMNSVDHTVHVIHDRRKVTSRTRMIFRAL